MYGSGYIFSKQFFTGEYSLIRTPSSSCRVTKERGKTNIDVTGWVVVGIIWIFFSLFGVGLFPIFEGRKTLISTAQLVWLDVTGKKHPGKRNEPLQTEGETEEEKESKGLPADSEKVGRG